MAFVETATQYPSALPSLSRTSAAGQFSRIPIKTTVIRFLWIGCLVFTFGMEKAHAETPTQAVDRIWNAWSVHDPKQGNFPPAFWKLSRRIAREQGLAVIPPIMARAKSWEGEEGLIFAMVMVSLPADKTIPVLEKYEKNGKPWEQQAASDFLAEIKYDYPDELESMSQAERKKFLEDTAP
jgi:hypothetical protein